MNLCLSVIAVALCSGTLPAAASPTGLASIELGLDSLEGPGRGAPLAIAGVALLARRRAPAEIAADRKTARRVSDGPSGMQIT